MKGRMNTCSKLTFGSPLVHGDRSLVYEVLTVISDIADIVRTVGSVTYSLCSASSSFSGILFNVVGVIDGRSPWNLVSGIEKKIVMRLAEMTMAKI